MSGCNSPGVIDGADCEGAIFSSTVAGIFEKDAAGGELIAEAVGLGAAIDYLDDHPELVERLRSNVAYFREGLNKLGFKPLEGQSAIVPIIVGETAFAITISDALLKRGVFVTGFGFPVVPEGTARIRVQISAALTKDEMDRALSAFEDVGKAVGILGKP